MSGKLKCEHEGEETDQEQRQTCGLVVCGVGVAHAGRRGTAPANSTSLSQEPVTNGSQSNSPRKSNEGPPVGLKMAFWMRREVASE